MSEAWTDPAWLEEAHAWIAGELERLGARSAGPVEQPYVRPWSTVLRVPTDTGVIWFKASVEPLAHEPAVIEILARRRPRLLPRLLAVDRERGWMLQADGGTPLRELHAPERWAEVLPLYAALQAEAAGDVEELLAAGAPDRQLALLPRLYDDLLRRQHSVAGEELRRLFDLKPAVALLCDELAETGLPETVQHDDLHSANVLVGDDGYVIFDWGDSCVAHPLFTLHVTLRALAWELDVELGAKEVTRARDAYLEPWTQVAPRAELLRALPAAETLGALARAIGWQALLDALPRAVREEYADRVGDRLRLVVSRLSAARDS